VNELKKFAKAEMEAGTKKERVIELAGYQFTNLLSETIRNTVNRVFGEPVERTTWRKVKFEKLPSDARESIVQKLAFNEDRLNGEEVDYYKDGKKVYGQLKESGGKFFLVHLN